MHVCVCVYIYVCVCVYIYVCVCVYIYMCVCVYIYVCVCVYVCTPTHLPLDERYCGAGSQATLLVWGRPEMGAIPPALVS